MKAIHHSELDWIFLGDRLGVGEVDSIYSEKCMARENRMKKKMEQFNDVYGWKKREGGEH